METDRFPALAVASLPIISKHTNAVEFCLSRRDFIGVDLIPATQISRYVQLWNRWERVGIGTGKTESDNKSSLESARHHLMELNAR